MCCTISARARTAATPPPGAERAGACASARGRLAGRGRPTGGGLGSPRWWPRPWTAWPCSTPPAATGTSTRPAAASSASAADELLGRPAVFDPAGPTRAGTRTVRWCPPGSSRARDLEYRGTPVVRPAGRHRGRLPGRHRGTAGQRAGWPRSRRPRPTSPTPAHCAPPWTRSARRWCAPPTSPAAQILLIDADGERLQVHGAAPAGGRGRRTSRSGSRRPAGAGRELSVAATRSGPGGRWSARSRKAQLLADPAWAPLHEQFRRLRVGDLRLGAAAGPRDRRSAR